MYNGMRKKNKNVAEKKLEDITLKDIYIGKADGLKEAQNDKFESYFYTGNNKYQELMDDSRKFIISGKKGTGKTVLAKYFELEENKKGHPTVFLTERDTKLKQFMEYGRIIEDQDESELFIEFSVYCEIAKLLLDNKWKIYMNAPIHIYGISKSLGYLQTSVNERESKSNFRSEKYSTNTCNTHEYETGATKTLGEDSATGAIRHTGSHTIDAEYEKNPFYNLLDEIKKHVCYLLRFIRVNLIYDDMDEYDEIITGNVQFVKFFNSFIKVINRINSDIYCTDEHYSRVILLIRSDMLIPLNNHSKNLAKIIADCQIKINWIKKVNNENEIHPLLEMILIKIRYSNKTLEPLSNKEILDRFFPKKINGIELINYILNATFGRPRDVINMLNIIKDEKPELKRFTKDSFQQTKADYSNQFVIELRNELSTHYKAEMIDECFLIKD